MTLMMLCALTLPMCRMAADPAIRAALQALPSSDDASWLPLVQAMDRHPDDAAEALSLLGGGALSLCSLRQCFSPEALAFFHLCGQCTPAELLNVLTRCTIPPSAEALALLVSDRRREAAMQRYGLQLLWRMNGDPALPDALALFPDVTAHSRSAFDILGHISRRLKEVQP